MRNFSLAERLLAYKEGLCSTKNFGGESSRKDERPEKLLLNAFVVAVSRMFQLAVPVVPQSTYRHLSVSYHASVEHAPLPNASQASCSFTADTNLVATHIKLISSSGH